MPGRRILGLVFLMSVLGAIGCQGEKPVVETIESKQAANDAASRWTPEMKANYEKFGNMESRTANGTVDKNNK